MKTLTSILSSAQLKFVQKVSPKEVSDDLLSGKTTGLAVIACSELGEVDAGFPEGREFPVYFWQNLGGCVCDSTGLEVIVKDKNISNVIVYGHYPCEIIEVAIREDFEDCCYSERLQEHFKSRTQATKQAVKERFGDKFDNEILQKATEDYVLRQLACLLAVPTVEQAAKNNQLQVHAWILRSDINQITAFDPESQKFVAVEKPMLSQLHCWPLDG